MTKKQTLHLVIHIFALLHALSSAIIAYFGYSDHVLLTAMTVIMLIIITRMYNYPVDVSAALILLSCFAGFYLGTEGAELIRYLVPTAGQVANVISTFVVTEILGWTTFIIVRKGDEVREE